MHSEFAADGKSDGIIQLSNIERQKWIDIGGKPIWEQWVQEMEKEGNVNARQILNTLISLDVGGPVTPASPFTQNLPSPGVQLLLQETKYYFLGECGI